MERNIITALILILIVLGLSGCGKKTIKMDHPKQPNLMESISTMSKAGKAIGCVFAPWAEECKSKREEKPHQSQEEYLEELDKDFNKLDEELDNGNTK